MEKFNIIDNKIIFCDECHKVPSLCQDARSIEINLHNILNDASELLTFCKETDFTLNHLEFMRDVNINNFLTDFVCEVNKTFNRCIYVKLICNSYF